MIEVKNLDTWTCKKYPPSVCVDTGNNLGACGYTFGDSIITQDLDDPRVKAKLISGVYFNDYGCHKVALTLQAEVEELNGG